MDVGNIFELKEKIVRRATRFSTQIVTYQLRLKDATQLIPIGKFNLKLKC